VCYCIWCNALVLQDVVGSGCGALRCRVRAHSATTQRPTTATNHSQQNQRITLYAVTHGLCSPEDGHNDALNMLRQKLIINILLLHLVGFLSLHISVYMYTYACAYMYIYIYIKEIRALHYIF